MGLVDFLKGCDDFFMGEQRRRDEDWERTFGHKIGKPWEKVETYGEQKVREAREKAERERAEYEIEAKREAEIQRKAEEKAKQKRETRVRELKEAFEKAGRRENFADPSEIDALDLTLTEKKIMQQCRRPKCHGCKLGWVCPKFHFE